jgi:DNA-directed RNA polymerase III subunit RPC6
MSEIFDDFCPEKEYTFEELFLASKCNKEDLIERINQLLLSGSLELVKYGQITKYKTKKKDQNLELTEDENLVFTIIKSSGSKGEWISNITKSSGLHRSLLSKVLRSLENKRFVRSVKPLNKSNRITYISYGIKSEDEIKLSNWYTDNEIDSEMITEVSSIIKKIFVQKKTKLSPITILEYIDQMQILSSKLNISEIVQLLDLLVYENYLYKVNGEYFHLPNAKYISGIEFH